MNRFKKAGTMLRAAAAFSRSGDAKGSLNAESEHIEDSGGAEGSVTDSKHGNTSPRREGDPESAEPVSPKKGRRGGLLSALSDRKLLGGGYCANLNTGDDDNSDNLDDDGNEIKLAHISAASAEHTAGRIGELPSKPAKESPTDKTVNAETNHVRTRRSQQAPSAQRRFRKTKAKEEATVKTDKDNEDLEATVAQVDDDGGEGGYSQLVLSERGEAPEQSPEFPGPDPEVSLTAHSAETATSHGDDDSANETDYEDKPSPNEKDERRGRSERTSKGTRPKDERGSSRKPQSRGNPKDRPRKPGEKRPVDGSGSTKPTERRRSNEHDPHRRRKSNDSVETDEEEALGEESAMPKNVEKKASRAWPSAQKVKDSEKEKSKDTEKVGSKKAWPSAQKVNSKAREKPKERELLDHLGKEKKKSERGGVKRANSSKSLFVGTKKEEDKSGETSPTMSVRDRGIRSRTDTTSQSERGAGKVSLLGQMQSSVSERNLVTSSEHTPSVLGPGTSDSIFHSDHGLDLGPLGSPSLDVGPAGSDSAALAALTTLSWTTRPASPVKKPKPAAAPEKDDDKPNGDSASGTPETTGPDGTVVASAGSPDHDESTKNKASKDGSKPRRDGKESSGATSSSKRNESSSSKSKRDGKDDSTNGKHSRESRDSRTRSRPESRQRGHSVNPEARSRGTSVRAQARGKKSEPEAPVTSERRRRRPSMGGSGSVLEGQGESRRNLVSFEPTATAQIDSQRNDVSVGIVPTPPGPEDASRQDSTPKAFTEEVTNESKDLGSPTKGSPTKKSPKHLGSPRKKSPRRILSPSKTPKGSIESDALPEVPLSSSKQNGANKPGSPRHTVPPKSPKSPKRERRSPLGSPRRRVKSGSSPTGSSPKISLQLAMALTGPPNLEEGDESLSSEIDKVGVAKIEANIGSSPSDDVKTSSAIVLSEDGDEASEDPLFDDWSDAADDASLLESFGSNPQHPRNAAQEQRVQVTVGQTNEDWSDAADDEGVVGSFGVKSANLDRGSEHSSVTAQSYSQRTQDSVGKWSDAADESEVANQEEIPQQSTVADQEKRAQGSSSNEVSEIPATVHADLVPETITPELTIHSDLEESKQNSETKAQEEGVQESIESKGGDDIVAETPYDNAVAEDNIISTSPEAAETMETGSTGAPLDDVANNEDEEKESNASAFLEEYEKQMKGVSLEVENEVPLMYISDMVSGKSDSEALDGTDLALATDSIYDNQAAETTEGGENKYASSSVYALLSSELAGSKERLAETRLEVSQLEKEVDLLRLRLNALERTLS
jgi:hypothetical protein